MRWVESLSARLRGKRKALLLAVALLVPAALALVVCGAVAPAFDGAEEVPVALVNLDQGATDTDGHDVEAGDDLVDDLLSTPTLAWNEVDEDTARAGLDDGTYALALVIPEDYSQKVVSLRSDDPQKATIELVSAQSENVLATRVGASTLRQVQSRLRADLGEDYLLSVLNDVRGQASRLTLTADGSVMLDAGYDALSQGADALADGLGQIASASGQLDDGLNQIATGVDAAGSGAAALGQSMGEVQQQLAEPLAQGAEAAAAGLDTVASTTSSLGAGVQQVASALQGVSDTLDETLGSAMRMGSAATALGQQSATLSSALEDTQGALDDAKAALADASGVRDAADAVSGVGDGAAGLAGALSSDAVESPGIAQRLKALDEQEDGLVAELRAVAADDTLSSEERSARLVDIDARMLALSDERSQLADDLNAASAQASSLADAATGAAEAITAAGGSSDQLGAASERLEASSASALDALGNVANTAGTLTDDAASVARGVLTARSTLSGATAPSGEQVPGLVSSLESMGQGVSALGTQLSSDGALGSGFSGIATGTRALGSTLSAFATATDQLATGNTTLAAALRGVAGGTSGMASGLDAMAGAAGQLGDGVGQLKDASKQVNDSMSAAADALSDVSGDPSDTADAVARPVSISASTTASATASLSLAPTAMVAALWLGALLGSLLLPAFDMRAVAAGRGLLGLASCAVPYLLLGVVEGAVGTVALALLGADATRLLPACGLMVAGGVAFALIAQALRLAFERASVGVSAVLLAVQTVCAGGVLPAAMVTGVFQALGAVLPVPLLSQAVRSVLVRSDRGVAEALISLAVWALVAAACSCVMVTARRIVRPERAFRRA